MSRFFLILLLSLLAATQGTGQLHKQYSFIHYTKARGLASNVLHTVVQDKKGFIWLGSDNSLQRYDGFKYITFKHDKNNPRSLPGNSIHQIVMDHLHRLWLLFSNGKVGIFDTDNFVFSEVALNVTGINLEGWGDKKLMVSGDGRIFYLLCSLELYELNEKQKAFYPASPYFHIVKGWRIWDFFEDISTKKYWISGNFGVAVFNTQTGNLSYWGHNIEKEPLIDLWGNVPNTSHFFIDSKSRLWFNSWPPKSAVCFIYAYDLKKNVPVVQAYNFLPDVKTYNEPRGFFEQKRGNIWIKGKKIFARYLENAHRFETVYNELIHEHSIEYDLVTEITEDREGNMWVATNNNGLYRFNPLKQSFANIRPLDSMNKPGDKGITSFIQTKEKTVLVGTWGNGLHLYDSNLNNIPLQSASLKKISTIWDFSLSIDKRTIWIGAQPGIFAYDQVSNSVSFYDPFSPGYQTIRQVQEDHHGNLWIGTHSKGVYLWPAQYKEKRLANRIAPFASITIKNPVSHIICDNRGYIWISTYGKGVFVIDPKTNTILFHFTAEGPSGQRLLNDHVPALLQYNDSTIIMLAGGVNIYHTKNHTISQIQLPDALSPELAGIEKDPQGNLWISAANGICKFNATTRSFTLFDRSYGISNDNFETASSLALSDGRFLFGCSNQFITFNPADIQSETSPPGITITELKVMNRSLPLDSVRHLKQLELPADENLINVECVTLTYGANYTILQKLEGLDENWKPTTGNQAVISYLPAGAYTLLLKSKDADGNEGKQITRLMIKIRPHFWRTWWFNGILIILAGAIAFAVHKQRVNRLLAIEKVRTRVARDLHDDIGSSLSTINILSKVAAHKIKTDHQLSSDYMQKITEGSLRLMESMDDIIWSINPVNDTMGKVLVRIKEFVADTLEPKEINFKFLVAEEVKQLKLDMESRRDFFLIFKEAINNIAKYAEADNVSIDINNENSDLKIVIADDGKGFDCNKVRPRLKGGHGLQNMKTRAKQLNGTLTINSEPGKGTQIQLIIPLA